jgi:plastocyanin
MKKIILLASLTCCFAIAFGKKFTIKVSNFQFTPSTVNAHVGDTIIWVWVNGTHTTSSISVPTNAKTWSDSITKSHTRFKYILKVAGTYTFHCKVHPTLMKGTLNVSKAASASDLTSFDVNIDDASADATLNWNTNSSGDVSYFSVQRSTDGNNFTEIGRVQPDLSNQYKFTDNNPSSSKYVYYQVQIIDMKGNSQLSDIRTFTNKNATNKLMTSIGPNPATNHLMLQFNADEEGTLTVKLYNQSGVFITQSQMTAYKGLNNGHFHLGDLSPGTYYIVCTLGRTTEKHTIIVK